MLPGFGDEFDPFVWFRWLLTVFVTAYALLMSGRAIWRMVAFFSGSSRQKVLLRRVLWNQLIRLRLRTLYLELTQIALLLAVLGGVLWLHRRTEFLNP